MKHTVLLLLVLSFACLLGISAPAFAHGNYRFPASHGLNCPVDAQGGKRAGVQTTHIRKKMVQPKVHKATPKKAKQSKAKAPKQEKVKTNKPQKVKAPKQEKTKTPKQEKVKAAKQPKAKATNKGKSKHVDVYQVNNKHGSHGKQKKKPTAFNGGNSKQLRSRTLSSKF